MATDRDGTWSSTMYGEEHQGITLAHKDSPEVSPVQGEGKIKDREAREEAEQQELSGTGRRAEGSGSRAAAEEPDCWRTCFEKDRDRILHCSAFRRLAGKTQVFVFPSDHQRTRLTHALEVSQVARGIASALYLNETLTEAIAIGHDCGHGPGGHASEDAFSAFIPGGYDHAPWGADVTLANLNLTAETLDGIRNHSWSRPAPFTAEGECVSWADRIAYTCHDFEDAVAAGIVVPAMLPKLVRERCGMSRSSQIGAFITGLVQGSVERGVIGMVSELAEALGEFRKFNYDHIYNREASKTEGQSVIDVLSALVEVYADRPFAIPDVGRAGVEIDDREKAVRLAVGYVSGMTDRFAMEEAVRLLGWERERLPRGLGGHGLVIA